MLRMEYEIHCDAGPELYSRFQKHNKYKSFLSPLILQPGIYSLQQLYITHFYAYICELSNVVKSMQEET